MNRIIGKLILSAIILILIYKISKNKKFKGIIRKIERVNSWRIEYFHKKYWCIYIKIKIYIKNILKLIICTSFIIILLQYSDIINIKYNTFKISLNKDFTIDSNIIQQLVIVQISSTFLITAVLSLVANLENKYIFGEKALRQIFIGNKINFSKVFYLLIILMFGNIAMMINKGEDILIILNVYITFAIISWLTYRIIRIFLQVNDIKKELVVEYYYENKKVMEKSLHTKPYNSIKLDNLYNRYVELIQLNNIEYRECKQIYLNMIDMTLFNNKKLVQEYFTEFIARGDVISGYLNIIEILIKNNKIYDAIEYYNSLLSLLNYHNTYIINSYLFDIYNQISDFAYKSKDTIEFKNIIKKQQNTIDLLLDQVYLCSVSDFSFTRRSKLNLLRKYKPSSKVFRRMYDPIFDSKHIDIRDKNELYTDIYDTFRMSNLNLSQKIYDITNFKPKYTPLNERNIEPEIIGIQVAQLLLATIYNKDKKNFNLFTSMNIDEKQMLLAKNMILLYIIYCEKYNGSIHSDYKDFSLQSAIKIIIENKNFFKEFRNSEAMKLVYSKIYKISQSNSAYGEFYSDEYIFKFSSEKVDMYFIVLCEILNIDNIKFNSVCNKEDMDRLRVIISEMMGKI